ncbi:MAG: penicillin-binding transpeptidase domain-containing protein [Bacteroides sp.]|nr:penicillin-binding transpeptidase domain-containing protein [Eubacterium sp.]MCM1417758.1 penicillin-binding transpeptidase domain-containing protein [Roseburia sp.]MCM1461351.1 penicillin-binding transpeptidase domain-containing protein [Bacteroides sp.]
MTRVSRIIRTAVLIAFVFLALFLCVLRLLKLQIVDGADYLAMTTATYTAKQELVATRGQIMDVNGRPLTTNRTVYRAVIQKSFLESGTENEILLRAAEILKKNGVGLNDSLPISGGEPFTFLPEPKTSVAELKERLDAPSEADAADCLALLAERYAIDGGYTPEETRVIAGLRFEMELRDFSHENYFVLADDISFEAVTALKEQSFLLRGVDLVEASERDYIESDTAPHVLGAVGAVSPEEYALLKEEGYRYNDRIGKYGIELAMESVLRGKNGERTITRDIDGNAVSDEITREVSAGDSVRLTIDYDFQNELQTILANQINWLNHNADRGNDCDAGAVVVLDVKTGAVRGMASYPTYNLAESVENYAEVLNRPGNPMYNRCISGLYRPGSAFKTITATDGLISGLIDRNSRSICTGVYTYYAASDYRPKCTGYHYGSTVIDCLKWSCNIFFYDLGRRLGIEELSSFAAKFGYGESLGLEIGGLSGQMSSPEVYESLRGEPWTEGNTLQAAIGQMDTLVTPLHLAVQALTLANDGVRYRPYLVDAVVSYDGSETLYRTEPKVAAVIEDQNDAFATVREGMIAVSTLVNWPTSSALWNFDYLPSKVAIKTGTAETGDGYYTSTVMGYYPADDPEIAFGIVLEKGEYSRYMVRNVIDAYFYDCYEPDLDEEGNVKTPWKRWSAAKTTVR